MTKISEPKSYRSQREKVLGDGRIAQYRWEFLRRNDEYQRDYASFADRFAEWIHRYGRWMPPQNIREKDPQAWSYFQEQVEPAAQKICERWDIHEPTDPRLWRAWPSTYEPKRYPVSIVKIGQGAEIGEDVLEPLEPPVHDYFSHLLGDAPHTEKGLRFLQVQIDITQPLEVVFADLEMWIEIARSRYRVHIGPLPDYRKRSRARLEEFESYLKVWDLRMQNLTFEEIATLLFPKQMERRDHRSAVTKRVRSQFNRARKLIQGDYRQIER